MRSLASVVWVLAFALSTVISGLVPVHTPLAAAHWLPDPLAAVRSVPGQSQPIYPGYAPGYGPFPSCQIAPGQLPPGWPADAAPPFSSTFQPFLDNQIRVAPNSPPVPIAVTQVSPPRIDTPRTLTGLPYQLLYNQQFPGPTIRVVSQQTDNSTLTVGSDTTPAAPPLTQLKVTNGVIGQPTAMPVPFPYFTTHLHGGHTAPEHDGHPDDLLPPMPMQQGGVGSIHPPTSPPSHVYSYTNDQQPQILWYHDHADMNTSPHVSQGLFAFYILEESPDDPSYPYLPREPYDIPLGLQVQQAGTQPAGIATDPPDQTVPNFVVTVNGVDSPKLDVEGRFYRFRVLNASADKSISLELCDGYGNNLNHLVWVIGTDGGMLAKPVSLPERTIDMFHDGRLDVFQAERYDLLIDFTNLAGHTLYLSSMVRQEDACMGTVTTAPAPAPKTCIQQEHPIVAFNVGAPSGPDNVQLSGIGNRTWDADTAFLQQQHTRNGSFDPTADRVFSFDVGAGQLVISGQPFSPYRLTNGGVKDASGKTIPFPQVIDPAVVKANSVEVWELTNTVTCATHPVHVHDIEFQNVMVNGQLLTPEQVRQFGWKDVFVLQPLYDPQSCPWAPLNTAPSISFMGHYESHWTQATAPPPTQIGDTVPWLQTNDGVNYTALTSGTYVFHCHNLFHEDDVMMGQFQVLPPPFEVPTSALPAAPAAGRGSPAMSGPHGARSP